MQWVVDLLHEALCLKMGSEGLLKVQIYIPVDFIWPVTTLCSFDNPALKFFVSWPFYFFLTFLCAVLLKVAVTAAGAALAGISMDLQFVLSIVSSWRICLAAAAGRISRYTLQLG